MATSSKHTATVTVRYKDGVLDPQGVTIHRALTDLGLNGIRQVRTGRTFELELEPDATRETVERACRALLANPVIESFDIEMDT